MYICLHMCGEPGSGWRGHQEYQVINFSDTGWGVDGYSPPLLRPGFGSMYIHPCVGYTAGSFTLAVSGAAFAQQQISHPPTPFIFISQ